ncbi:unnamed protein product [Effrenium voratum]|nr:unnamed protein product [Effrenium voratum]
MCSFLVTSWLISNLTAVNFFLQPRGPDGTKSLQLGPFIFVHNLLHMTGERVWQPFADGEVVAVYNGEIYNSRQVPAGFGGRHLYRSDGECLLPCYRHHGARFPKVLDGEWALVLVDFSTKAAILSTDVFGTKPLWYSCFQGFHASSYKSALLELGIPEEQIRVAAPNQVLQLKLDFSLDQGPGAGVVQAAEVGHHSVHEFDLRQFKTSTEDWQAAFRHAVWKRTAASNHPVFVGLSSGYDSGALHLALEYEAAAHAANYFTVVGEELSGLIRQRLELHNRSVARAFMISLSLKDFQDEQAWLQLRSEFFRYGKSNWAGGSVQEDGAAAGLSAIFRLCREAGILVYISGAGADEIISDYGFAGKKFFPHSSFGGQFPEELSSFFPWRSVFLGTQRDYLMKEEVVAGSHGLEARYPFLDRQVVQEFLWLDPQVKNELYKRPVHDFLSAAGYPFDAGNKDGFAAGRNLKLSRSSIATVYDSLLDVRQPKTESLSCTSDHRWWQGLRSQLVAFLMTPEQEVEATEDLAASLLAQAAEVEKHSLSCLLGEVCLQLLMVLLANPQARTLYFESANMDELLQVVLQLSWPGIVESGWPLFELLNRLSKAQSAEEDSSVSLRVSTWLPVSGCVGTVEGEAGLDAPMAVALTMVAVAEAATSASPAAHLLQALQASVGKFWDEAPTFGKVLGSARMCEVFVALSSLSKPFYRVNLADAWHLA